MLISICIPCYKSSKTLPKVYESVVEEFKKHPEHDYQFVLVNDGSPDATFAAIKEIAAKDEKVTGVDLSRNYGQVNAKMAALQYAKGDVICFMDDDGQHPAEGIFQLLAKMQEGGYDVVYAHFAKKKASFFKKLTSDLHNHIAEKMENKPKGVHRSSFTVWSRAVVDALKDYHSPFTSIGSYLMKLTTKYADVEVEHKERIAGRSGYTFKKLFKMWANIFFSFSMKPLRMATVFGVIFSLGGFGWGLFLIIRKLIHPEILSGYTSTLVILLLIGGLIMIFMGIFGEYIGRLYMTVTGMPQYNVREVVGDDKK